MNKDEKTMWFLIFVLLFVAAGKVYLGLLP